ncbi:Ger(x)C family spore germination protein [Cytobacillus kochii]|uniref:Ger(x)C family spore germination protein n=1 Tax=unclassified Cytobacillus TaxID=2675268 RepID=UPI002EC1ED82|nr:Ger(x)C family spore germination protein [Cytobacillus kochii]
MLITMIMFLLLSGCQKPVEIQYQAYAIGFGVDFIDEEYVVYVQFLDFSNVAKTESSSINQDKPVWLGVGTGNTINKALTNIYKTMQIKINFDHINSFIFSENIIKYKLKETTDSLSSNYNIRVHGWIYGTSEDLEEILTLKMPFYYPYTSSIINQPLDTQTQVSEVPAIDATKFLIGLGEATKTILLPRIEITNNNVRKNELKFLVPYFNGGYFIKGGNYKGFLNSSQLSGYIKANKQADVERSLIQVNMENKNDPVEVELRDPKTKLTLEEDNFHSKFKLNIKSTIILREGASEVNQDALKHKVEDKIRDEAFLSLKSGREKGIDVYLFEDYLFRHHNKIWKQHKFQDMFKNITAEDINVEIKYSHSPNKVFKSRSK